MYFLGYSALLVSQNPFLLRGDTMQQKTAAINYDYIAQWYQNQLSRSWIHGTTIPSLLRLLPEDLAGKRVCDIGCGSGIFSRELARMGAQVVGLDISSVQLAYAEHAEAQEPLGIRYIQTDAEQLSWWDGTPFFAVTSNLAFTDIANIVALAQTIAAILPSGGILVFSIPHPCAPFSTGEGLLEYPHYFREGYRRSDNQASIRGRVGWVHRRVETYFQAFADAFTLNALREPQPISPTPVAYASVPAVLLMCWVKKQKKGL